MPCHAAGTVLATWAPESDEEGVPFWLCRVDDPRCATTWRIPVTWYEQADLASYYYEIGEPDMEGIANRNVACVVRRAAKQRLKLSLSAAERLVIVSHLDDDSDDEAEGAGEGTENPQQRKWQKKKQALTKPTKPTKPAVKAARGAKAPAGAKGVAPQKKKVQSSSAAGAINLGGAAGGVARGAVGSSRTRKRIGRSVSTEAAASVL